jgi:hypothetical protein
MMDEPDYGGEFREPTVIHDMNVGRRTPLVYKFNYDLRQFEVWWPPPAPPPFIIEDEGNNPKDPRYPFITDDEGPKYPKHVAPHHSRLDPLDIPVAIVANGANTPFLSDSVSSHSSQSTKYPITEERKRSKDHLRSLEMPALPLSGKDLKAWNENLPWLLSGQHWCHFGLHASDDDITKTTTDNQGLSHDFLVTIKRSAIAHTSAEHQ